MKALVFGLWILLFLGCNDVRFAPAPVNPTSLNPPPGGTGGNTGSDSGQVGNGCDSTTIYNLYNTSVTHHSPTQNQIANACVDADVDYGGNINFGPDDSNRPVRFAVTCASRWCSLTKGDSNAVGVIEAPIHYNGSGLDLTATIPVECRSSITSSPPGICETQIQNHPPLETRVLNYSSGCTPCGCDHASVSSHWHVGPDSLISCGTQYCTGLNSGFQWGILSEANSSIYVIRCSRAAF